MQEHEKMKERRSCIVFESTKKKVRERMKKKKKKQRKMRAEKMMRAQDFSHGDEGGD